MLWGRLRVGDDVQQTGHGLDSAMYQIWSEAREESSSRLPSARVCDFFRRNLQLPRAKVDGQEQEYTLTFLQTEIETLI